jgi:hypothetical protein
MNKTKRTLLAAGFLAAVLAGCLNPASDEFSPRESAAPAVAGSDSYKPFTVTVYVEEDEARTVAGPDAARIAGRNIRNFIQVIVVDAETKKVVAIAEDRRSDDGDDAATLTIKKIRYGRTYNFLMLQGHWEWKGKNGEKYNYTPEPPTLLAAGFTKVTITKPANNKRVSVPIDVYPIWVDTQFVAASPALTVWPSLWTSPKTVLHPVPWQIRWTIKRWDAAGVTEQNGLSFLKDALLSSGDALFLNTKSGVTWTKPGETASSLSPALYRRADNIFTLDIPGTATSGLERMGTEGSAYFNLEYVPFSLEDPAAWGAKSTYFNGGVPKWIIRNGVNDLPQDDKTDFGIHLENGTAQGWHKIGKNGDTANGNGAVAFTVAVMPPPSSSTPVPRISNSGFSDKRVPAAAIRELTTAGYQGTATVFYKEVAKGAPAPTFYTDQLGNFSAGTYTGVSVPLTNADNDMYVILYKDGAVSKAEKIDALYIIPVWGNKTWYVSAAGVDQGSQSDDPGAPFATVNYALAKIAEEYANNWPAPASSSPATIVILGPTPVPVREPIIIDNAGGRYPPIILSADNGGQLCADIPYGVDAMLQIVNGAQVTMTTIGSPLGLAPGSNSANPKPIGVLVGANSEFVMESGSISNLRGGVSVRGTGTFTMEPDAKISGNSAAQGGGVYVYEGGTFTLIGGKIFNNSASSSGGGVYVNNGTVYMSAGQIYGNSGSSGGGVYVNTGTFTMSGGKIFNNNFAASGSGGGVDIGAGGTFAMYGGEISGNSANNNGGGVGVAAGGTFTMNGNAKISGNSTATQGGGVSVSGTFTMINGEISGNSAKTAGGGVWVAANAKFTKTLGTVYGYDNNPGNTDNNTVKDSSGNIVNNKGHAAYAGPPASVLFRRETTAGPGIELHYNDSLGISGGWGVYP